MYAVYCSTCSISPTRRQNLIRSLSANSHTYYYWYSITHSLFQSRLKTFLFRKSFPPQPFLFFFGIYYVDSPRLFTVTSEHIRLLLFSFSVFFYTFQLSFPCGRLSCMTHVGSRSHAKIASRIVSYRNITVCTCSCIQFSIKPKHVTRAVVYPSRSRFWYLMDDFSTRRSRYYHIRIMSYTYTARDLGLSCTGCGEKVSPLKVFGNMRQRLRMFK